MNQGRRKEPDLFRSMQEQTDRWLNDGVWYVNTSDWAVTYAHILVHDVPRIIHDFLTRNSDPETVLYLMLLGSFLSFTDHHCS